MGDTRRLDREEVELMVDGLDQIGGTAARFIARLLPSDVHAVSAIVDADPQAVCKRAADLVTEDGNVVAQRQPGPGVLEVRRLSADVAHRSEHATSGVLHDLPLLSG